MDGSGNGQVANIGVPHENWMVDKSQVIRISYIEERSCILDNDIIQLKQKYV